MQPVTGPVSQSAAGPTETISQLSVTGNSKSLPDRAQTSSSPLYPLSIVLAHKPVTLTIVCHSSAVDLAETGRPRFLTCFFSRRGQSASTRIALLLVEDTFTGCR